jgi:competence protein ComEA
MKRLSPPRTARIRAWLTRARERLAQTVSTVRAWRWGTVIGRAVLGGLGLVILGAIGQSAFARNVLSGPPPASPDASTPAAVASVAVPLLVGAPLPPAPSPAPAPVAPVTTTPAEPSHGHATPDDPVYLNQATLADLHRLPGIGPKRAEAILALRTRLGHFRQIEDLLKVKGVGRSSLKKLRPLVRLDPPPAVAADASAPDARASP